MKPQSRIGKSGKEEGTVQLGLVEEWEFVTTGRRNRRNYAPEHRNIIDITGKGPEVRYCVACLRPQGNSVSTEQRVYQDSQNPHPQALFRPTSDSSFETELRHTSLHGLLWAQGLDSPGQ